MTANPSAYINKQSLLSNYLHIKKLSSHSKVMSAVKGNAYGHGIENLTKELHDITDSFVVARISEAQLLRKIGTLKPITVLGGYSNDIELKKMIKLDCDIVIHNLVQIDILKKSSFPLYGGKLWIKIDTGMNRMGINIEFAKDAIKEIQKLCFTDNIGLMTHLSDAEIVKREKNYAQLELFRKITNNFKGDISFANSAVIMNYDECISKYNWNNHGDIWVSPGIALYGISPLSGHTANKLGLSEVMSFKSKLISIKSISKGETVGYNSIWKAPYKTHIGTIAVGYGDGYSKSLKSGTPVLINNRKVPLVGLVSMDLINVDLGQILNDSIGDEVTLWGVGLPIEEVAESSQLSSYALATGISERVRKVII